MKKILKKNEKKNEKKKESPKKEKVVRKEEEKLEKRIGWKLERRKLSELKPHSKNPRQFTEKGMKDLESSIDSIGFAQPINVNKEGTILSGHARVLKLQEMGYDEVDVYVPDRTLTPKQEEEILVRMNANTAGQFDYDKLANEFELPELKDWGLELPDIEELEPQETVGDDEVPEEPIKPITVRGDLYELGKHRLLCGDSTMIDDVEKLMDGKKADMIFTDPPYGMNLDTNFQEIHKKATTGKNHRAVLNDDKPFDPNCIFAIQAKERLIWGADYFADKLPSGGSWYVWDKVCGKFEDRIGNEFELLWSERPHKRLILHHEWVGYNGLNNEKEDLKRREHPNQKPLRLLIEVLQLFSDSETIIDLFLGSGSTLIACEKTKRICYGMELDEKYCDVIVKRYIQFCETNNIKPSVKRNGEDCLQEFKQ